MLRAANDNADPGFWSLPPIVGYVGDHGRVTWAPGVVAAGAGVAARSGDGRGGAKLFPNDPREA